MQAMSVKEVDCRTVVDYPCCASDYHGDFGVDGVEKSL